MTRGETILGETLPDGAILETDIAIVGSGAGGAVVAAECAEAGARVCLIEEGPYLRGADYGRLPASRAVAMLYRDGGTTVAVGPSTIQIPLGRCVGGTTVINSGTALRLPEEVFAAWRRGTDLGDLTWERLLPCFEKVEERIGFSPVPEELVGADSRLFRAGAEKLGWRGEILTRAQRDCRGAGRCYLGCPRDAKMAVHLSYVPRAQDAGCVLATGLRAVGFERAGRRVTGVRAKTALGARVLVRAGHSVLAAGALISPALLPGGFLGRHVHHAVGRHMRCHPAADAVGLYDRDVGREAGVPQAYHLTEFLNDGISIEGVSVPPSLLASLLPGGGHAHKALVADHRRTAVIGLRIIEEAEGRVVRLPGGRPFVLQTLSAGDRRRLARGIAAAAEIHFAAGAREVYVSVPGHERLRSVADARRLAEDGLPAWGVHLTAYHPHGTIRISADPAQGPCDTDGRVRAFDGLYVADGSLLPASPIVNPQVTIMALATHVARGMMES